MSDQPFNKIWEKQHNKLVRATFKKAIISNVNTAANTADVFFAQNPTTVIRAIPLASQIVASQVMVGDRCRVDVFDETNPNDMVVAYIYGRIMAIQKTLFNSGNYTFSNGQIFPVNIPHGLVDENGAAVIPDVYGVMNTSKQNSSSPTATYDWFSNSVDNTNIAVGADTSPSIVGATLHWFVIKFP